MAKKQQSKYTTANNPAKPFTLRTAKITRGDITATATALGTLEPEQIVDVTAQVAGTIVSFGDDPRGATDPNFKDKPLDYNSPVEEGTVLARIDDALYKAKCDQEQFAYKRAAAELEIANVKYEQSERQATTGLGKPDPTAKASVTAAEATLAQCKAALEMAQINLDRTVIKSPVKGGIIARRINIGQNVAPDPKSPSLFLIAKDLHHMQIWAMVNEADIGNILAGMTATFTVDAFPNEIFTAKVVQIRKDAQATQNAVLYTVVLVFDNSDLKLLPYLTANLKFEIESHKDVLIVPNIALRWRPTQEMFPLLSDTRHLNTEEPSDTQGCLWLKDKDNQHIRSIKVQLVLTDGRITEISSPDIKEGMEIVVGTASPSDAETREANDTTAPKNFRRGEKP